MYTLEISRSSETQFINIVLQTRASLPFIIISFSRRCGISTKCKFSFTFFLVCLFIQFFCVIFNLSYFFHFVTKLSLIHFSFVQWYTFIFFIAYFIFLFCCVWKTKTKTYRGYERGWVFHRSIWPREETRAQLSGIRNTSLRCVQMV